MCDLCHFGEVRVCGLRCRSGSSLYIYRVYLLLLTYLLSLSYLLTGKPVTKPRVSHVFSLHPEMSAALVSCDTTAHAIGARGLRGGLFDA